MFLIGTIKTIAEKKLKLVLFLRECLGEGIGRRVHKKTNFISVLHCRFGGGNKNFIKKGEIFLSGLIKKGVTNKISAKKL